jgi:hypothetical protein
LRYGLNNNDLKSKTQYSDSVGQPIPEWSLVKDLGVWLSPDGSYRDHIEKTLQKASNLSGWILRTFHSRNRSLMLTLFKSVILSQIDYCSPMINASLSTSLSYKLEQVQRAYTRKIENLAGLTYWDRLKCFKLYSILRRQERFAIIYMFKIIRVRGLSTALFRTVASYFGRTLESESMLLYPWSRETFQQREQCRKGALVSQEQNCLMSCLGELRQRVWVGGDPKEKWRVIFNFKNELDSFLQLLPDQPTIPGLVRAANSNSILQQIYFRQSNLFPCSPYNM